MGHRVGPECFLSVVLTLGAYFFDRRILALMRKYHAYFRRRLVPLPPRSRRRNAGFTFIEVMIVVVVLGILATVVIFSLGNVTASAAVSACQTDVKTVLTAVQAYEAQNQGAVPDATALTTGTSPYLQSFPSSPYFTITLVNGAVMVAAPSSAPSISAAIVSSCSGAGPSTTTTSTTTTTTPPTTTTTVSNGVTVTPGTSSFGSAFAYGGQETLNITNPSPITSITVTINAAASTGMSYASQFTTYPGGYLSFNESTTSGGVQATWTDTTQSIWSNYNGEVALQLGGNGTAHVTSGDSWSVTTTSGGVTSTVTGTF
jgi:general secretion pathway protein G